MMSHSYHISPGTLNIIRKRYNKGGSIYFDDYVACCVNLQAHTANFKRKDFKNQGSATFKYDEFIQSTMTIECCPPPHNEMSRHLCQPVMDCESESRSHAKHRPLY